MCKQQCAYLFFDKLEEYAVLPAFRICFRADLCWCKSLMTLYVCSKGGGFVRNESFTDEELDKCSIPILNAKSLSLAEIARRCAAAETPLIIKVSVDVNMLMPS